MQTVLLVIHILLAFSLIGVILLQKSEGGALGIGGGGGGGGLMTGRATANLLTKTTAVLATLFILTSLALAVLAGGWNNSKSLFDENDAVPAVEGSAPAEDTSSTVPTTE